MDHAHIMNQKFSVKQAFLSYVHAQTNNDTWIPPFNSQTCFHSSTFKNGYKTWMLHIWTKIMRKFVTKLLMLLAPIFYSCIANYLKAFLPWLEASLLDQKLKMFFGFLLSLRLHSHKVSNLKKRKIKWQFLLKLTSSYFQVSSTLPPW